MMAESFVKAGARVSIVGRHAQPLEAARETLARHGEVDAIECDLGSAALGRWALLHVQPACILSGMGGADDLPTDGVMPQG